MEDQILLFFNGFHNEYFDSVMYNLTWRFMWVPMYVAMVYCVFKSMKAREAVVFLLMVVLTITLADQVCSHVLRPIFHRLRPSNLDNPISAYVHIVANHRGGRYGLPSCHASNTAALSMLLVLHFRSHLLRYSMLLWFLMICYTRMYLGVHYPGDLLLGTIVGATVAVGVYYGVGALANKKGITLKPCALRPYWLPTLLLCITIALALVLGCFGVYL